MIGFMPARIILLLFYAAYPRGDANNFSAGGMIGAAIVRLDSSSNYQNVNYFPPKKFPPNLSLVG